MEIPIYIDGERTGTLTVTERGRLREMDARLRKTDRVVRLQVFGRGEAWYLGIPEPEGEGLRLRRSVSPGQLRGFPREPLYAAEQRLGETDRDPRQFAAGERRVVWLGGKPHYF